MKRAVLCVPDPQNYIDQLDDYSIMIINPAAPEYRQNYLLDHADWSLKITNTGSEQRDGADYANEKLFWYTSGTTGDSKFCSFTQQQLDRMAELICNAYDITANDRYVGIMPLWHAHGQGFYWVARAAGCQMEFLATKNLRDLPKHAPTFITAVPSILQVIKQLDFDHLRFIRGASSALSDQLYQDLKERFKVPVIEAFGMTETLSQCFTNPLHGEQRMGTVGLPDGVEVKLEGQRLIIKGPNVSVPGWFDTGDLAEQDEKGYYRILGRSVDQLNIKGKKFNPSSLESQVLKHITAVKECVIFGNHELNCLYVGDCDPKEILTFLLSLDPHLRPAMLNKTDEIPLQHSGKISRSYLKTLFNCR
jgi:acyl-coenzyme A synthetase/AMP-(fatty) acid ligase